MIDSALIALEYIKKEDFLGSYKGMRYRLGKVTKKEKVMRDGIEEEINQNFIEVVTWPEPYNFFKTPENKKQVQNFPFSGEGKEEAIAWLNKIYIEKKELWECCIRL